MLRHRINCFEDELYSQVHKHITDPDDSVFIASMQSGLWRVNEQIRWLQDSLHAKLKG